MFNLIYKHISLNRKPMFSIILNYFFKSYLEIGSIYISFFSITIYNVYLFPYLLESLDLPLVLRNGRICKIYLKIPWWNLYSKPISILIDDIDLICGSKNKRSSSFDSDSSPVSKSSSPSLPPQSTSENSVVNSLSERTKAIFENFQIEVNRLTVRFEDFIAVADPVVPYAVQITFDKLSFFPTNKAFEAKFPNNNDVNADEFDFLNIHNQEDRRDSKGFSKDSSYYGSFDNDDDEGDAKHFRERKKSRPSSQYDVAMEEEDDGDKKEKDGQEEGDTNLSSKKNDSTSQDGDTKSLFRVFELNNFAIRILNDNEDDGLLDGKIFSSKQFVAFFAFDILNYQRMSNLNVSLSCSDKLSVSLSKTQFETILYFSEGLSSWGNKDRVEDKGDKQEEKFGKTNEVHIPDVTFKLRINDFSVVINNLFSCQIDGIKTDLSIIKNSLDFAFSVFDVDISEVDYLDFYPGFLKISPKYSEFSFLILATKNNTTTNSKLVLEVEMDSVFSFLTIDLVHRITSFFERTLPNHEAFKYESSKSISQASTSHENENSNGLQITLMISDITVNIPICKAVNHDDPIIRFAVQSLKAHSDKLENSDKKLFNNVLATAKNENLTKLNNNPQTIKSLLKFSKFVSSICTFSQFRIFLQKYLIEEEVNDAFGESDKFDSSKAVHSLLFNGPQMFCIGNFRCLILHDNDVMSRNNSKINDDEIRDLQAYISGRGNCPTPSHSNLNPNSLEISDINNGVIICCDPMKLSISDVDLDSLLFFISYLTTPPISNFQKDAEKEKNLSDVCFVNHLLGVNRSCVYVLLKDVNKDEYPQFGSRQNIVNPSIEIILFQTRPSFIHDGLNRVTKCGIGVEENNILLPRDVAKISIHNFYFSITSSTHINSTVISFGFKELVLKDLITQYYKVLLDNNSVSCDTMISIKPNTENNLQFMKIITSPREIFISSSSNSLDSIVGLFSQVFTELIIDLGDFSLMVNPRSMHTICGIIANSLLAFNILAPLSVIKSMDIFCSPEIKKSSSKRLKKDVAVEIVVKTKSLRLEIYYDLHPIEKALGDKTITNIFIYDNCGLECRGMVENLNVWDLTPSGSIHNHVLQSRGLAWDQIPARTVAPLEAEWSYSSIWNTNNQCYPGWNNQLKLKLSHFRLIFLERYLNENLQWLESYFALVLAPWKISRRRKVEVLKEQANYIGIVSDFLNDVDTNDPPLPLLSDFRLDLVFVDSEIAMPTKSDELEAVILAFERASVWSCGYNWGNARGEFSRHGLFNDEIYQLQRELYKNPVNDHSKFSKELTGQRSLLQWQTNVLSKYFTEYNSNKISLSNLLDDFSDAAKFRDNVVTFQELLNNKPVENVLNNILGSGYFNLNNSLQNTVSFDSNVDLDENIEYFEPCDDSNNDELPTERIHLEFNSITISTLSNPRIMGDDINIEGFIGMPSFYNDDVKEMKIQEMQKSFPDNQSSESTKIFHDVSKIQPAYPLVIELTIPSFDLKCTYSQYDAIISLILANFPEANQVVPTNLRPECGRCTGHHDSNMLCSASWLEVEVYIGYFALQLMSEYENNTEEDLACLSSDNVELDIYMYSNDALEFIAILPTLHIENRLHGLTYGHNVFCDYLKSSENDNIGNEIQLVYKMFNSNTSNKMTVEICNTVIYCVIEVILPLVTYLKEAFVRDRPILPGQVYVLRPLILDLTLKSSLIGLIEKLEDVHSHVLMYKPDLKLQYCTSGDGGIVGPGGYEVHVNYKTEEIFFSSLPDLQIDTSVPVVSPFLLSYDLVYHNKGGPNYETSKREILHHQLVDFQVSSSDLRLATKVISELINSFGKKMSDPLSLFKEKSKTLKDTGRVRAIANTMSSIENTLELEKNIELKIDSHSIFRLGGLKIILKNETLGIPIGCLHIKELIGEYKALDNFNSNGSVALSLLGNVYNVRLQTWEPVVEPFTLEITYEKTKALGNVINFTAREMFNINISHVLVSILTTNSLIRGSVTSGKKQISPYFLKNNLGENISFVYNSKDGKRIEDTVGQGVEIPLNPKMGKSSETDMHKPRAKNLGLERKQSGLTGLMNANNIHIRSSSNLWVCTRPISMEVLGSHHVAILSGGLSEQVGHGIGGLIAEISLRNDGSKVINIRSAINITNNSGDAIELAIKKTVIKLNPKHSFALPLQFVHNPSDVLLRPVSKSISTIKLSEREIFDWYVLDKETILSGNDKTKKKKAKDKYLTSNSNMGSKWSALLITDFTEPIHSKAIQGQGEAVSNAFSNDSRAGSLSKGKVDIPHISGHFKRSSSLTSTLSVDHQLLLVNVVIIPTIIFKNRLVESLCYRIWDSKDKLLASGVIPTGCDFPFHSFGVDDKTTMSICLPNYLECKPFRIGSNTFAQKLVSEFKGEKIEKLELPGIHVNKTITSCPLKGSNPTKTNEKVIFSMTIIMAAIRKNDIIFYSPNWFINRTDGRLHFKKNLMDSSVFYSQDKFRSTLGEVVDNSIDRKTFNTLHSNAQSKTGTPNPSSPVTKAQIVRTPSKSPAKRKPVTDKEDNSHLSATFAAELEKKLRKIELEKKITNRPDAVILEKRNILMTKEMLVLSVRMPYNEFEMIEVKVESDGSLADVYHAILKEIPHSYFGEENDVGNYFFEEDILNNEAPLPMSFAPLFLPMDYVLSSLSTNKLWLRNNSYRQLRMREINVLKGILGIQPEKLERIPQVLMFPFKREIYFKTSDQTGESEWSQPFDVVGITSVGISGAKEVHMKPCSANKQLKTQVFELSILSKIGVEEYSRTVVTTIAPRFYLLNNLKVKILVKQVGTDFNISLPIDEQIPLYWADGSKPRFLQINIANLKAWAWSSEFSLDKVGNIYVRCRGIDSDKVFNICINMDKRGASTLVTLKNMNIEYPPYKIINNTAYTYSIRQKGFPINDILNPNSTLLWVWDSPNKAEHVLEVSLPYGCTVSSKSSVEIGEKLVEYALDVVAVHIPLVVKTIIPDLSKPDYQGELNVSTGNNIWHACICVLLDSMLYCFYSSSSSKQVFNANSTFMESNMHTVVELTSATLDTHCLPNKQVYSFEVKLPSRQYLFRQSARSVNLDEWILAINTNIKQNQGLFIDPPMREVYIAVKVMAEGPTRVLSFEEKKKKNEEDEGKNDLEDENDNLDLAVKKISDFLDVEYMISVKGIGLSFIDSIPAELFYLSLLDINLSVLLKKGVVSDAIVLGSIRNFQIDIHDKLGVYDIMLAPKVLSFSKQKESAMFSRCHICGMEFGAGVTPSVHFCIVRKNSAPELLLLDRVTVFLKPLEVNIDEQFIWRVVNISKKAFAAEGVALLFYLEDDVTNIYEEYIDLIYDETCFNAFEKAVASRQRSLYLGEMIIFPIKVVLSLKPGNADPNLSAEDFVSIFESSGVSVEKTKFKLRSLELSFFECAPEVLLGQIRSHYTIEALKLLYKVLGSFNILGDPSYLISTINVGLKEAQGLGTVDGKSKGLKALVGHTVEGITNTSSKLTRGFGGAIALASFDKDYQRRRNAMLNLKQATGVKATQQGAVSFGMGFMDGLSGIVLSPIKGAKEEGAIGFFKGTVKGALGVIVKPTVGLLDLVSKTSEGLRTGTVNLFGLNDDNSYNRQVRPVRVFHENGTLLPYDYQIAYGSLLLRKVLQGYYSTEIVKICISLEPLNISKAVAKDYGDELDGSSKRRDSDDDNDEDDSVSIVSKYSTKSSQASGMTPAGSPDKQITPSVSPKSLPKSFSEKLSAIFKSKGHISMTNSASQKHSDLFLEKNNKKKEESESKSHDGALDEEDFDETDTFQSTSPEKQNLKSLSNYLANSLGYANSF